MMVKNKTKISIIKLIIFRAKVRVRALTFFGKNKGVRVRALIFPDLGLGQRL